MPLPRYALGRKLGPQVCEALGIDSKITHVREVTLGFGVDSAVVATVEIFPTEDQLAALGINIPEAEPPMEKR